MSHPATLALIRAAWQEQWNRQWRFSRYKSGLWMTLIQVGLIAVLIWRLRPAAGAGSPALAALAMLAQAALWAFMATFLMERQKLFGGKTLPLLHVSPAPALAPLLAAVGANLPRRAWSMLLWSVALSTLLPPGARWLWLPVLWALGVAAGALGQLAGLLALVAWVRLAPRSLNVVWVIMLLLQVAGMWYLIYLMATGLPLEQIGQVAGGVQRTLMVGLGLLLGVPGLAMAAGLALASRRMGDAYREGWLALAELADASARPRTSRWPGAGLPGQAGALLAREWLALGRNPVTLFRLGAMALLLLVLVPARGYLAGLGGPGLTLAVVGGGAGLVLFCFGEVPAALFGNEGARVALLAVAGVRPGRLLAAKLLATLPFGPLSFAAAWAVSLAAGKPALSPALLAGALGLGGGVIAVTGGAFDLAYKEAAEETDAGPMSALLEQVPRGLGGNVSMMLAMAWVAGSTWALYAGRPGLLLPLALLPPLAAGAAWARLRKLL